MISTNRREQYCRYVNWSAIGLIFMAVAVGGLYAVWWLENITLGFIAILLIYIVIIGGTAIGLKACIRR